MADFKVPAGFAATVAGDLIQRARAYNAQHLPAWAEWVEPRVALVTELAVVVAGRGERDDLLSALAAFDNGRWNPGRRVERLLSDEILVAPEPSTAALATEDATRCEEAISKLPNANKLLHRLVAAYMSDVVETARQMRDRAAAELVAQQPDARIDALVMRAATAESEATRAKADAERGRAHEERLLRENGLMRAELRFWAEHVDKKIDPDRYIEGVLAATCPLPVGQERAESGAPVPNNAPLPKGIRDRGNGRYEALIYRSEAADGRQRGVGTFDTVEAAVTARETALSLEGSELEHAAA